MLMDLIVCAMVALIFDRPVFLEMKFSKDINVHSLFVLCIGLDFLMRIVSHVWSRFLFFNICCFLVLVET